MGKKVYKIRMEFDWPAAARRANMKIDKLADYAEDLDIPFDEGSYDYEVAYSYEVQSEIMENHSETIDAAILSVIERKGFAVVNGEQCESERDLEFSGYSFETVWASSGIEISACYLLVDDPDVAMLLKLQFQ